MKVLADWTAFKASKNQVTSPSCTLCRQNGATGPKSHRKSDWPNTRMLSSVLHCHYCCKTEQLESYHKYIHKTKKMSTNRHCSVYLSDQINYVRTINDDTNGFSCCQSHIMLCICLTLTNFINIFRMEKTSWFIKSYHLL